ncbi:CLUMA_CG012903, isoform A [Clunio marinus]|uniref:CLUMA_CG012903, isoform A n=1 Tax=Clunio marinus TaxID=568069 RepID=A0A1J1IH53_9DIPT|nr:CLUMA_CG012903, isoform A [Clunio marinus]
MLEGKQGRNKSKESLRTSFIYLQHDDDGKQKEAEAACARVFCFWGGDGKEKENEPQNINVSVWQAELCDGKIEISLYNITLRLRRYLHDSKGTRVT